MTAWKQSQGHRRWIPLLRNIQGQAMLNIRRKAGLKAKTGERRRGRKPPIFKFYLKFAGAWGMTKYRDEHSVKGLFQGLLCNIFSPII